MNLKTITFLLAVTCPYTIGINSTGCHTGWQRIEDYCMYVATIREPKGFTNVYMARIECLNQGADLATLHTEAVAEQVTNFLLDLGSPPEQLYIGLHDLYDEGVFQWIDGMPIIYSNWAEGEPNSFDGDEDCVVLDLMGTLFARDEPGMGEPQAPIWHDYPCCTQKNIHSVLCSKPALDEAGKRTTRGNSDFAMPPENMWLQPVSRPDSPVNDRFQSTLSDRCYKEADECLTVPPTYCANCGVCVDDIQGPGVSCRCQPGYTGKHCEEEERCGCPPQLRHAFDDGRGSRGLVGDEVTYVCHEAYRFQNRSHTQKVRCTPDLNWEPQIDDCQEIRCEPIKTWLGIKPSTSTNTYLTELNYTCDEGMAFPDGDPWKLSVCNISGFWSPYLEDCIESGTARADGLAKLRKKTEAPGAEALGTVAIIFLAIELSLMLMMDADNLVRHGYMFLKNCKKCLTGRCGTRKKKGCTVMRQVNAPMGKASVSLHRELDSPDEEVHELEEQDILLQPETIM